VLASRWMLSRTRAPGLSSVPPRPRQPRPPAPRSANPARTCPPRTAGGNVTDDDSDRVLCHLTAALVDLSRSRLDGPATRHLRSVGSAHPGRARRRRLSPGGRRGPRRIVCGVAARCPRPARSPQQLGRLGRGELHTSRSASGGSRWIDCGWVTDMSVGASGRDEYDVWIVGGHHARPARFSGFLPQFRGQPWPDPSTRHPRSRERPGTRQPRWWTVSTASGNNGRSRLSAIGSRHPVTAPATSDPSDRSPRSQRWTLDIDVSLLQRAGLDVRCRAPPPTTVYPAWAQGSADIAQRHSAPAPQRLPPGGDHGEHRPTLTQDLHGRKRCPSSVSTRSGIPSGTWTG